MQNKNQMQHHHKYFKELSWYVWRGPVNATRNLLKKQVNRIQNRHSPPNPTSLHGIEIPEKYKVIRQGEPLSFMHDSSAQGDKRILMYTTYDNIC